MAKKPLPAIFISPPEAGKILGSGAASIECGLRNGTFPIGWAWCTDGKDRRGQWHYRIPKQAFFRALETGSLIGGEVLPCGETACRLYHIWSDMKQRCGNPHHKKYALYGGRGIGYAREWEQYPAFEAWAYANGYREYLALERIRPDRGYTPENCRWAAETQPDDPIRASHLFTVDGETHTVARWAEIWQVHPATVRGRIRRMEQTGDLPRDPGTAGEGSVDAWDSK